MEILIKILSKIFIASGILYWQTKGLSFLRTLWRCAIVCSASGVILAILQFIMHLLYIFFTVDYMWLSIIVEIPLLYLLFNILQPSKTNKTNESAYEPELKVQQLTWIRIIIIVYLVNIISNLLYNLMLFSGLFIILLPVMRALKNNL